MECGDAARCTQRCGERFPSLVHAAVFSSPLPFVIRLPLALALVPRRHDWPARTGCDHAARPRLNSTSPCGLAWSGLALRTLDQGVRRRTLP